MSTHISRFEKNISLYLSGVVDDVGETLKQRITELLDQRPDLERAEFGRRIGRGHSWISEFFAGIRSTNNLRLVIRIAKVLGVPASYLLNEPTNEHDGLTLTLLSAWKDLEERDKKVVLTAALGLRPHGGLNAGGASEGASESPAGTRTTKGSKKHR